jgi:hypothetical protein
MTTLTINRETRDALRRFLGFDVMGLEDFDKVIESGDRDAALRLSGIASFACRLLEDLGWATEDERNEYEITLDAGSLQPWLLAQRAAIEGARESDLKSLRYQEAGVEDRFYCDYSQADSLVLTRSYLERHREDLSVIARLLDELESALAVA